MRPLKGLSTAIAIAGFCVATSSAWASFVDVGKIIYQTGSGVNAADYSGTVEVTGWGSSQLTFVLKNTSADGAVTDRSSTAQMLLTGLGFVVTPTITEGVSATATGTMLNFDAGQTANLNNQWVYANSTQIDGFNSQNTGANRVITTVDHQNGLTRFDGGDEKTVDGPSYGAVSAQETQFGNSLAGVQDNITFVLNFASAVNEGDISDVVLAFGSPNAMVPEPTTVLAGVGALGLLLFGAGVHSKRSNVVRIGK